MNVRGRVVAAQVGAASVVVADVSTLDDDDGAPVPSATITLAAASFDSRDRAARNGTYGSTRAGSYILLPGSTDRYVWCTQDDGTGRQCGYDPGDVEDALTGLTGIQVELDAGIVEADDVATAYRAALSGTYTAGGTGAELVLSGGGLDVEAVEVGGAFADRGDAGIYGSRTTTVAAHGNAMNDVVCSHATSPAFDCLITAIGVHVSGGDATTPPDPDEPIEVALYIGGTAGEAGGAAFVGTTLVAQGELAPDAVGYARLALTPAQATVIPASSSLWLCAKGGLGYTVTRTNYHTQGSADSDLTNQQLVVLEAGGGAGQIDPTFGVPFPASLEDINVAAVFGVVLMINLEFRTDPFVGDASWAQTMGVHNDAVLTGSESDLGAGGANVLAQFSTPPVAGMYMGAVRLAIGGTHTGQFRVFSYLGGVSEDPDGATLAHDYGQTAGSTVDDWVEVAAPVARVEVPPSSLEWVGFRGDGSITISFGANANPEVVGFGTAEPPDYRLSSGVGDGDEYEMTEDNPNHSTDDTDPAEATVQTDASDTLPGNYPGLQRDYVADGDVVL